VKHVRKTRPVKPAKPAAPLTMPERQVLVLLALGESGPKIAPRLGISPHTVDWRIRQIKRKLKAKNLLNAVYKATAAGLFIRVVPVARLNKASAASSRRQPRLTQLALRSLPRGRRARRIAMSRHWERIGKG
jgi:DNA-binding CsgD family transcriptional regulator